MASSQQCINANREEMLEGVLDKVFVMISKERYYSIHLPVQDVSIDTPSSPTTVIDSNHLFAACPISKKLTSNVCREVCQWMYKVRLHQQPVTSIFFH